MKYQLYLLLLSLLLPFTELLSQRPLATGANPVIVYDEANHQFRVDGLSLPPQAMGAQNAPKWTYFWEFGDGHFSTESSPQYCFKKIGLQNIRLSLVPHYSHAATKNIRQSLLINSNCGSAGCARLGDCDGTDYGLEKLVQIETNANNELVPENEIQVVIHYDVPNNVAGGQGDLFLFYNDRTVRERLGFAPLTFRIDDPAAKRLHNATSIVGAKPYVQNAGPNYQLARNLLSPDLGYTVLGFSARLEPGKSGRLFLSLEAATALDSVALQGKKDELLTHLKTVWVPRGHNFNEATMTDNYSLKMLSVHDPNRIRIHAPRAKAHFVRRSPEMFDVEVEFQNLGGGAASRVEVTIPWPENLDASTIEMTELKPDCPPCNASRPSTSAESCFEIDNQRVAETGEVRFLFHNIMLLGKRQPGLNGKKNSKGLLRFNVMSNRSQSQTTDLQAMIRFDQYEVFKTNKKNKRWQHRGLGLKVGRNFGGSPADYYVVSDEVEQWFNLGVYYRKSALKQGFTPFAGWEISLAGQGFENEALKTFDFDNNLTLLSRETVGLQSLDLQAFTEMRIGGLLALAVGVGPSIPLKAEGNIAANLLVNDDLGNSNNPQFDDILYEPELITGDLFDELLEFPGQIGPFTETSAFGLLDKKETVAFVDEDITSSFSPGFLLSFSAEFGLLNSLALGVRQNIRVYPNSYRGKCLKINNFEAYARFNLFSLK